MAPAGSDEPLIMRLDPMGALPGGRRFAYRRSDRISPIEYGVWSGDRGLRLGLHFHDEIQMTFVLTGRYRFFVGGQIVTATAGEWIFIPALLPHASVPHDQCGTTVINIYVPVGQQQFHSASVAVLPMRAAWLLGASFSLGELSADLDRTAPLIGVPNRQADRATLEMLASGARIDAVASVIGLSREGFIRQFSRQIGMSPHAFRLMQRLNEARLLLRRGETIAAVAAETGFADQSHLGRQFRRVFGATPGAYREANFP